MSLKPFGAYVPTVTYNPIYTEEMREEVLTRIPYSVTLRIGKKVRFYFSFRLD